MDLGRFLIVCGRSVVALFVAVVIAVLMPILVAAGMLWGALEVWMHLGIGQRLLSDLMERKDFMIGVLFVFSSVLVFLNPIFWGRHLRNSRFIRWVHRSVAGPYRDIIRPGRSGRG